MTGAEIARLLIIFGPPALDWLGELSEIWSKEMTPAEVKAWCLARRKSYDEYIAVAKARLGVQ